MTKKYVIETESGSMYKVEDVSHLFGTDRWVIYEKGRGQGKKDSILWLGQFGRRGGAGVMAEIQKAVGGGEIHVRVLEQSIAQAFSTGSCLGCSVFYISEDKFERAFQLLPHVNDPVKWEKIKPYVAYTSAILHLYRE